MIVLDTDICIEILRKNRKVIERRIRVDDSLAVSFMSVAELYYGAEKSNDPAANNNLIEEFLLSIEVVHTDLWILRRFGLLKKMLADESSILPDADILIAATAYERSAMLITGNVKHFEKFPNLQIENWR